MVDRISKLLGTVQGSGKATSILFMQFSMCLLAHSLDIASASTGMNWKYLTSLPGFVVVSTASHFHWCDAKRGKKVERLPIVPTHFDWLAATTRIKMAREDTEVHHFGSVFLESS